MMRKLKSLILAAACIALLPGCADLNKAGYKTVKASQISEDHALAVWNDYLGTERVRIVGLVPEIAEMEIAKIQAKERQVKAVYKKYQAAVSEVSFIGAAYSRAVETGNGVDAVKSRFEIATAVAAAAFSDFINLLQQFGVKL